jgi:FtsH-binding integral membrane protein
MRALVKVAGAVVLVAYAALVASVRSFTWPALVLTAIAGLAVLVLAARRPEPEGTASAGRGIVLWAVLTAAVIAWELVVYLQSPRDAHPTISSMLDALEGHRPLRAVLFIGWIALGRELSRR